MFSTIRSWFESFRSDHKKTPESHDSLRSFRLQYSHFKDLLTSNTELGQIMAEIDERLRGATLFGMGDIRALATRGVFHTMRMATALNAISGNRYPLVTEMVEHINKRIMAILDSRPVLTVQAYTMSLSTVTSAHVDVVGGKCANLGELRNAVQVPIPRGFAITTKAYASVLYVKGLREDIQKILRDANPEAPSSIAHVSQAIHQLINQTPLPAELMEALFKAWDAEFENTENIRVALRSSAVCEDGALSFSGQYRTVLGVTRETLESAFREVLASLFSPQAITYRIHHGMAFEQCAMGMACIEMVDAVSSGIIFSRHPVDPHSEEMVLNAIWGLGAYAVDGIIEPDTWHIRAGERPKITHTFIAEKKVRLVADGTGKHEEAVPETERNAPSLTTAQVLELAGIAARLEAHYRHPQDIEWATDNAGRIIILQSRPMRQAEAHRGLSSAEPVAGATLILDGADIACSGIGSGPAVLAQNLPDLANFPENGILVAPHSLPRYVLVMNKAQAIVTEAGSITGHMASLAREFDVPTLSNAKDATNLIQEGQILTVDALAGRVYAGAVQEILDVRPKRRRSISDSPVHAILRQVAEQIVPLHLVDPKSPLFRPETCTTLHDIMRFVHERCYTEMFRISDRASDAGAVSRQLKVKLPIDLHCIDLGGGIKDADGPYIYLEQIESVPLQALLSGMLRPDVHINGPRPVDVGGFLSVMSQHLLEPPNIQSERFGERSYCIISDKYLNFSSRVGYHYSVADAYCGQTDSKNYITFQFKGGAADEVRRERRVRCIALILTRLGFTAEVRGDMVQAKFQKYPAEEIRSRLDQLGRLLIVTRQMDMLMVNEEAVNRMADNFMNENYH